MNDIVVVLPPVKNHSISGRRKETKPVQAVRDENGCLVCVSHKPGGPGYPRIRIDNELWGLHRYLWTMKNGPIPKGMCVCHKCDNRMCCNVDHYYLGTIADNNADMWRKGRGYKFTPEDYQASAKATALIWDFRGSKNGNSKLTEEQVIQIRKDYPRLRIIDLAKQYSVSCKLITLIVRREVWKHV